MHEREKATLKIKLKSTEDTSEDLNSQLIKLKKEYDSYKVKVQHAFKKQKSEKESNNSAASVIEAKNNLNEMNDLKESNELLSKKLTEATEKSLVLENELETMQEELTKVLQRNTGLLSQLKEKENEWKLKSQKILNESVGKSDESEEIIRSLRLENEAISLNCKEKLKVLTSQNSQSISLLQNQLIESKQEIDSLNKQINELREKILELEMNAKNSPLNVNVSMSSSRKDSSPQLARITPQKSIDLTNNFILRQVEVRY